MIVTKTGAKSAVISGIYFGGATPSPTPSPTPTPSPSPSPSPGTNTPPQVVLTVPSNGSIFVAGMDITMAANASDADGAVSKVEFFQGATLVGTDTTAPYNAVWNGAPKGTFNLTAVATDNEGAKSISPVVSITVTNSPNSVGRAKGKASSMVQEPTASMLYSGAADSVYSENTILAGDITTLTSDITQAYTEFQAEVFSFGTTAPAIDTQIKAALLFSKATRGLALRAATSSNINNNLKRIASHLAMAEDLMRYGVIRQQTLDTATSTKTRSYVVIGDAKAGYGMSTISEVAPASLGSIAGTGNLQPMIMETVFARMSADGSLPYEVGGLSVTVGGVAVPVLYASPWGIKFFMPDNMPLGVTEVIVSSQDGYICQGTINIQKSGSRIMTTTDEDNGFAVATNSRKLTSSLFEVLTPENFSSDKRTRLNIFATGISASAFNSNSGNDVNMGGGNVRANFAESVTVEAKLTNGLKFNLPVEFAGVQGLLPGLDQITVVLIPELKGAGTVQLTLVVGNQRSNAPSITIK